MVITLVSIILSTPFIVANIQIFNPRAQEIPNQILSRVEINPANLNLAVGASPIELSALAYDTNNKPIWSGVTYNWGISSSKTPTPTGDPCLAFVGGCPTLTPTPTPIDDPCEAFGICPTPTVTPKPTGDPCLAFVGGCPTLTPTTKPVTSTPKPTGDPCLALGGCPTLSIGIVNPTSGNITNFRPINAGSGDLFVNATFLGKTVVESMLVTVGSELTPTPKPTGDPCLAFVGGCPTLTPTPTPIDDPCEAFGICPTPTVTPKPTGDPCLAFVGGCPTPTPIKDPCDAFVGGICPTTTPTPTKIIAPTPVLTACALTSGSWVTRSNPVIEGDTVGLIVRTNNSPSCIGKRVEFQVWENDSLREGGIDDKAKVMPGTITISGNTATSSWIAEWQNDCRGLCNPPEYYFKAKIAGESKVIKSGREMLIVNQRQRSRL